jgi:hypothetical protein
MTAVIAVPVYKPQMTELEEFSLSRCVTVLGRHPVVFFGPSSLSYRTYLDKAPAASTRSFPDSCFTSVERYSELLLSRSFYETFLDFDYVLIHQLDAFVFHDALDEWCRRGYDYIGAPFLDEGGRWFGVGNGGFSLRKARSCLDVLSSVRTEDVAGYWAMVRQTTPNRWMRAVKYYRKVARMLGLTDDLRSFRKRFIDERRPEDLFWSLHAVRFHPPFRIAPVDVALRFAVEGGLMEAQTTYLTHPPFGCHQTRFLRMIQRYLRASVTPESEYEAVVWRLAESAGLYPNAPQQRTSGR